MKRSFAVLALGLLPLRLLAAGPIPSPESVLGFKVGEDRKLADWHQIVDYFRRLHAASDRVRVEEVGKTTEGEPFLLVTISSEANLARLEEIRQTNLRLWDPRGLADDEAERLLARGKTIVALNHGIHSSEVAAPQTAMETAYRLATSQDPAVLEVLDQTVILILPSHNPDGTQKVNTWYREHVGTPFEGGEIPFLYHRYAGHDNNRDWYMFTQVESRLTVRHLYDRWRPQIVHDLHQMGTRGARMFLPPYTDPYEPNVDPALIAALNALGTHMAARLTSEGRRGVVVNGIYDGWTPARAYPHTHGGVRILSEAAAARMASPLDVGFGELQGGIGYDARTASWNFPAPWPGGTWRLRDIVEYQLSATRALLEHAARHRDFWLRNFLDVNRRAATRSEPFAFVIPAEQKDPLAASTLLQAIRLGGVEVHRAKASFSAGGQTFPGGTHVILMAQPASGFAKSLLERQQYPDLRQYPGGPPRRPYDVTAHTLPLLMGVSVFKVTEPLEVDLGLDTDGRVTPGSVEGQGGFLALGHKNGDLVALGRLLREGVSVRWVTEPFADRGRIFPPGTLLVPVSARARVEALARELGLHASAVSTWPRSLRVTKPRVGLYQSYVASIDEGWTRFVFEKQVGVDYQTLHDRDVRAGGLRTRFDVVVLPGQVRSQILNGHAPGAAPDEYVGGLGKDGGAALKGFVEAGGTLVALDSAADFAIGEWGLPVTNVLARGDGESGGPTSAEFYCPGAILRVQVNGTSLLEPGAAAPHPPGTPLRRSESGSAASLLGHGLEGATPVWFESSPAFEVAPDAAQVKVVARYGDENPLLSGWLLGEQKLRGKAALVEVPLGRGRVILFGFRPQYRAQSWATYVALLNAVYTSVLEQAQ